MEVRVGRLFGAVCTSYGRKAILPVVGSSIEYVASISLGHFYRPCPTGWATK